MRDDRMVPGLTLDGLKAAEFVEPIWIDGDENDLSFLGKDQEQSLIRQQKNLAVAVAAFFPKALARFKLDAGENAVVEAVNVVFVHDKVIERRFQAFGSPMIYDGPLAVLLLDVEQ